MRPIAWRKRRSSFPRKTSRPWPHGWPRSLCPPTPTPLLPLLASRRWNAAAHLCRRRPDMARRILVIVALLVLLVVALIAWLNLREEAGAPSVASAADPQRGAY